MPCWTVKTYSIDFNVSDFSLLEKAAKAIGGEVSYINAQTKTMSFYIGNGNATISNGQITVRQGFEKTIDQLKRAYTKEVLNAASVKFKIPLETKNESQLTLKWRY